MVPLLARPVGCQVTTIVYTEMLYLHRSFYDSLTGLRGESWQQSGNSYLFPGTDLSFVKFICPATGVGLKKLVSRKTPGYQDLRNKFDDFLQENHRRNNMLLSQISARFRDRSEAFPEQRGQADMF